MEAGKSKVCRVGQKPREEPMLWFKSDGRLLENLLLLRKVESLFY